MSCTIFAEEKIIIDSFPYKPGYIGKLDAFSPEIAHDLERLLQQLDPALTHLITQEDIAYFRSDRRFHQYIVVEELDNRPAIVGTANLSLLDHSYDTNARLTNTPALYLGSIVVDENVRGKGVAMRLWNALLEVGRSEGIHLMQFTSRPGRGAAHSFYAKVGATEITPLARLKVKADGTERITTNIPGYEEEFELAKGSIAAIASEKGSEFIDAATAKSILAESRANVLEQVIPVNEHGENTTALFSVSF